MEEFKGKYLRMLQLYVESYNKQAVLNQFKDFGQEILEKHIHAENVLDIHKECAKELDLSKDQILMSLEILKTIAQTYGYSYKDYQELVDKLYYHDKEMDLASRLQQTMLQTEIPQFDSIQIGVISVAAQKVSGDYFNLIDHKDGTMSFAVADVIGKGIPAALAMSMIKFGMDSYGHSQLPSDGLKRLNRVVEKNVNQDMFVTMFYGLYEEMNHLLYCSSAGHEPGYVFRAEQDEFEEIDVRGRVLGVRQLERYK